MRIPRDGKRRRPKKLRPPTRPTTQGKTSKVQKGGWRLLSHTPKGLWPSEFRNALEGSWFGGEESVKTSAPSPARESFPPLPPDSLVGALQDAILVSEVVFRTPRLAPRPILLPLSQGTPMKQPILFLDIDGVLNTETMLKEWRFPRYEDLLEPSRVALANDIVAQTRSKVVLSSSWRKFASFSSLQEFFRSVGFAFDLDSSTPTTPVPSQSPCLSWPKGFQGHRGSQIGLWLKENGYSQENCHLCILDDDWEGIGPSLFPVLVGTTIRDGLTPALAEEAVRLLQGETWRMAGVVS